MKTIPLSEIKDDLSRFLARIAAARQSLQAGLGRKLEELAIEDSTPKKVKAARR